jgi:flagellar biosynthesis/type III secretory pathway protein FliH
VAANSALGVIGWIAIAFQAVATASSAVFGAKDKALQKQVELHLDTVKNLQKKYETLEDAIDGAWSTTAIQQYNKELQATTQSMIVSQKAAIAAQQQKKGANEKGSDAYNELQEMKAELAEMENQLAESLEESFSKVTDGILDSVHDAAKEFTDAWYEAYAETGDGLKGLEENFNEMFLTLAKNQAAMQITGAFAERWKKDLEKYINADDTELTKDEAKRWAEEVRRTMPELSAALEAFLGTIHEGLDMGGGKLSALQKGIQGITEDTAQVLEAIANSSRVYLANIDSKMDLVLANLGAGAEENPMLEQMMLVAKNTSAINTLLNSLVKGGHSQGGVGLKVFMN